MTVDALWKAVSRLWRQFESLRAPRLWIRHRQTRGLHYHARTRSSGAEPTVGGRHERRGLLVAGQDELDRGFSKGFDDIQVFFSRDPKNPINVLILEGGDEQIRSFEHALSPGQPCESVFRQSTLSKGSISTQHCHQTIRPFRGRTSDNLL